MRRASMYFAFLLVVGSAIVGRADVIYDAADDYSDTNNPNGVWSSGYTTGLGTTLNLFDTSTTYGGPINVWTKSGHVDIGGTPAFLKNYGVPVPGAGTDEVSLHPSQFGDYAVLRFTAPVTGEYTLLSQFFEGNTGETDAYVLLNEDTVSPLLYAPQTSVNPSYNTVLNLTAGDTLDFVVGALGNFDSDLTPLEVQITLSAVPEPTSMALVGMIAAPFGWKRLRQKLRGRWIA